MMEKLLKLLRRYCLESTIVGLKYLYIYPDIVSRCFWSINMIVNLLSSLVMGWLLYSRFSEMPTRVTIESQFESVTNLPYPAITICSPNQMTMSAVKYFNKSLIEGNVTINLQKALPMVLGFYELLDNNDVTRLKHLQDLLEVNRYTILEVLGLLPQSCDRFLKRCIFEEKIIDCAELLTPILTTHGLCCAFNSMYKFEGARNIFNPHFVNHTVRGYGLQNSLVIIMDYEPEDAIPGTLFSAGGVRVMYTDWSEFPTDDETSLLNPHGESYHSMTATYTYCSEDVAALPVWSRQCNFGDEHKLNWFKSYRNSDCDHMCYVEAVYKACHCWLHFLPNIRPEKVCKLPDIPCIGKVIESMADWLSQEKCNCPRDCVSRQYRADVILGNFKALPYVIRSMYQGLVLNKSTSAMHFFFGNPVYVKQKQETVISIINLVSNLGGVFGLFMGCSGISVLELFFYIYLALKYWLWYMYMKKWQQHSVTNYSYTK